MPLAQRRDRGGGDVGAEPSVDDIRTTPTRGRALSPTRQAGQGGLGMRPAVSTACCPSVVSSQPRPEAATTRPREASSRAAMRRATVVCSTPPHLCSGGCCSGRYVRPRGASGGRRRGRSWHPCVQFCTTGPHVWALPQYPRRTRLVTDVTVDTEKEQHGIPTAQTPAPPPRSRTARFDASSPPPWPERSWSGTSSSSTPPPQAWSSERSFPVVGLAARRLHRRVRHVRRRLRRPPARRHRLRPDR